MLEYEHGGTWNSYSSYKAFYHIHTWPDPKNPKKLLSKVAVKDCREYYVKGYRESINSGNGFIKCALKAYALVTTGHPQPKHFEAWQNELNRIGEIGVHIINSFEKKHGWPLTKVYPVKCTNIRIPFIFYVGPRKWTTSPYLMSIWSLCLRLGRNNWIPKKILELDHDRMIREMLIAAKCARNNDGNQMLDTLRHWDPFMGLYKELFGGKPRKYHWDKIHLNGGNDRPEGIQRLINGSTYYKKLHLKYKRLREAKGIK